MKKVDKKIEEDVTLFINQTAVKKMGEGVSIDVLKRVYKYMDVGLMDNANFISNFKRVLLSYMSRKK